MTNENETNPELRPTPSAEQAHTELATYEQLESTRGSTIRDETARANRLAENANRRQEPSGFFSADQAQAYRSRWKDIQVSFVDDPASSIEQANVLVRDAM